MPRSGVKYSPIFEWREAAHWDGRTWEAFCRLDGEEQSAIVAHYRTHHQLEAVVADAQIRDAKQRQPKRK